MNTFVNTHLQHELPALWRFALRLTQSRPVAEELVQKTAVRALEKSHQFQENSQLRSWLFSIMHSVWKNELRSQSVRKISGFNLEDFESYASVSCQNEKNQLFREVVHQVNKLPEAQRVVMLFVCVEGYSYQETADMMDIAVGTVMSRLSRARQTIGQTFLDHNISDANRGTQHTR